MALPSFNKEGVLPPGEHLAQNWEVIKAFFQDESARTIGSMDGWRTDRERLLDRLIPLMRVFCSEGMGEFYLGGDMFSSVELLAEQTGHDAVVVFPVGVGTPLSRFLESRMTRLVNEYPNIKLQPGLTNESITVFSLESVLDTLKKQGGVVKMQCREAYREV